MAHRPQGPWPVPPMHSHEDLYHVVLYTDGGTDVQLGGEIVPIARGDLALCAPGVAHNFAPARLGSVTYSEVNFAFCTRAGEGLRLPFNELLAKLTGVDLAPIPLPLRIGNYQTQQLTSLMCRVVDAMEERTPMGELRAQQTVSTMLAFLAEDVHLLRNEMKPTEAMAALAAARAHIEANYRDALSVDGLAAMAHLSQGHFLRAFKQAFDTTPIAYQLRLRAEAACHLLRFTDLLCKQIATDLGYADAYHFSKSFKRLIGVSPSHYRKGIGQIWRATDGGPAWE